MSIENQETSVPIQETQIETKNQLGELELHTSTVVWIATALLHKENPSRTAFRISEIENKVKELNLLSVQDTTISQHITSHCVANSYASPDTSRILFRVQRGLYRLYRNGDSYHPTREYGKTSPPPEIIPEKYGYLLEWYEKEYLHKTSSTFQEITKTSVNPPFVKIDDDMRIKIPDEIMRKLEIGVGDHIVFIETTAGKILIKKARLQLMV